MEEIIIAVICALLGVAALIVSIRQFMQKGFVLNNAYLWATKEERSRMDKRPHYRQSAIVFALFAAFFFIMAVEILLNTFWLSILAYICPVAAVVYAMASSIKQEMKRK